MCSNEIGQTINCNMEDSIKEDKRRSEEQVDVQPMDVYDEDGHPQSAEEPQTMANPAARSTSRPYARRKVKAPQKGRSSLRPPRVGDHSRSSEAMEHSCLNREVEYGQGAEVEDAPPDAIMFEVVHIERTSTDLNALQGKHEKMTGVSD